jgi:hypothetical protein
MIKLDFKPNSVFNKREEIHITILKVCEFLDRVNSDSRLSSYLQTFFGCYVKQDALIISGREEEAFLIALKEIERAGVGAYSHVDSLVGYKEFLDNYAETLELILKRGNCLDDLTAMQVGVRIVLDQIKIGQLSNEDLFKRGGIFREGMIELAYAETTTPDIPKTLVAKDSSEVFQTALGYFCRRTSERRLTSSYKNTVESVRNLTPEGVAVVFIKNKHEAAISEQLGISYEK